MTRRPRVHWQVLDGTDDLVMWTPGWLADSNVLRWSLANDLRVEGLRDDWHSAHVAADVAAVSEGYVGDDEIGDVVEATPTGYAAVGDEAVLLANVRPATFARLHDPD